MPALNSWYRTWRERAEFFVVYIQEAHPTDAWQLPANLADGVLFATTKTAAERDDVAGVCVTRLAIELPALVDEPDDRVDRAYTGWPERLYVIDRDGTIAYKSGPGPFGFKPGEAEAALTRLVNGSPS